MFTARPHPSSLTDQKSLVALFNFCSKLRREHSRSYNRIVFPAAHSRVWPAGPVEVDEGGQSGGHSDDEDQRQQKVWSEKYYTQNVTYNVKAPGD